MSFARTLNDPRVEGVVTEQDVAPICIKICDTCVCSLYTLEWGIDSYCVGWCASDTLATRLISEVPGHRRIRSI